MPNQPVFGTLYTLDRFVYRQNSTLLYCTIKEIIILKIACFGVIYVPFSRIITRYYVYFFTRVRKGHIERGCRSTTSCTGCGKKHHASTCDLSNPSQSSNPQGSGSSPTRQTTTQSPQINFLTN